MQTQSSSSNMTTSNAMMSEITIQLAYESSTKTNYLLGRLQTACVGRSIVGVPDVVPGYDSSYPNPTNYNNVGLQAQAVVAFAGTLSQEILNFCQQLIDTQQTSSANCTMCPTLEECAAVSFRDLFKLFYFDLI